VYEERHQQVLSRIREAVIEVDDDWEITFLNERTEDVTGLDRMTLLGRDFWDVFSEARGTRFEDDYRQAMHTREPVSFVDYYAGLDEWFDISVYPNDDGGLAFYFLPITEHRERAAELAETNQLLSTLLETLPVGVTVLNTDGRIAKANQRAGMAVHQRRCECGWHLG
jgi:PAS domain S-box-containing protein